MEFKEIVNKRYATRGFDGKKISQSQVDELLEMILLAPTSYNLQPWKIQIIEDQKIKDEIQLAAWNQPQVGTCSHLLVFCANLDLETLVSRLAEGLLDSGMPKEKVEAFIGIIKKFVTNLQGEKRLAWADKQTYIALGNGMNGAAALGFDSCPMEGFDPKKVKEILNLSEHLVPTVLLPVGYGNDTPRPKFRFNKEEMFFV